LQNRGNKTLCRTGKAAGETAGSEDCRRKQSLQNEQGKQQEANNAEGSKVCRTGETAGSTGSKPTTSLKVVSMAHLVLTVRIVLQ
jgi:hypothetical protein